MNTLLRSIIPLLAGVLVTIPLFAQEKSTSPLTAPSPATSQPPASGQPSAADMQKMMGQMMELSKLNENHKLLAGLAGTWSYTVKMWMSPDPAAPPSESKGTAVRKPIMNGRYFTMDVSGKMQMPGPDGKMKDMEFKGTSIEAYDNVKQKFVSTWADNMSTGIMMSEGTYDPATKTFTYTGEMEMMPGMKSKVREVVKITDSNHHAFEFYEDRGGQEAKTMEINYTRKK
ncbi:MAG: DUF1579 domain-containing protein [Chthoniobacterales bacterium]|nr:DUF1579 domain-containing protein [Chthoniobacterales bacterium]